MRKSLILIGILAAGAGAHLATAQTVETPPPGAATLGDPAAANVCAKLPETECAAKEGCSWLPGYRIPNGAEVPGYCRPAPRSIRARRAPSIGPNK